MKNDVLHFAGIDISKEKFDVAVVVNGNKEDIRSNVFTQDKEGFKKCLAWIEQLTGKGLAQTVFCMEHTGIYNLALVEFLCDQNLKVCVENARQIKLSMGLQRGKNDKVDARRIALYIQKNMDELKPWQMPRKELQLLKSLVTQRNRLIQTKVSLEQHVNELESVGLKMQAKYIKGYNKGVKGLVKDIEKIEADINEFIRQDDSLNKMLKQITSIPGIGTITAIHLIVYTNEFKSISDGKQLACHCGVAPFEHTSGKSVRGRARVHHAANKTLKTLLHMCALAAVKVEGEFKRYYERKLEEGKHVMSILNAIKNKLLLRVAAVLRRDTNYVSNYVYGV